MPFSPLDSRLLGPLFVRPPMARVFDDTTLIAAMLRVEAALARAEAAVGLVPHELVDALEQLTPADFNLDALGRGTGLAGVPAIPFVKTLQIKLPRDLEPYAHKGATTQDIADTAFVLQMRQAFTLLADDLAGILAGLAKLAERHMRTPCVGRTYGQQAAPVSFGYKVAVWLAGIAEAAARFEEVRGRALVASLGGPVGTLAGLGALGPAVLDQFAAELGLGRPPIAWHVRRAGFAEVGTMLATLLGALGKMAADIAFMAATEVGEVAEPWVKGRGGSSSMPHKRNPVGATVILAAAENAVGLASTLLRSLPATEGRPVGAWHAEWHALPQLFGLASGALAEARTIAEGLEVDAERMLANLNLTRGLIFADGAAAVLAPLMGRGRAHDLVEAAAQTVRRDRVTLGQAILAAPNCPDALDHATLAAALDPTAAIDAAAQWVPPVILEAHRVRGLIGAGTDA
jgi:3-carboxy-cis,cis-muconate cycloisomerase